MTCIECGTALKTKRENYKYTECGLPGITLMGVEVARCRECGDAEVVIPNIEGLHRAIAQALVRRRARLAPEEIRYLRKFLGLSGVDFAQHMGVTPETVSRWELGRTAMGPTADKLLRWLVATRQPVSEYPLDMLKETAQDEPRSIKVGMKADEGGWHADRELELV